MMEGTRKNRLHNDTARTLKVLGMIGGLACIVIIVVIGLSALESDYFRATVGLAPRLISVRVNVTGVGPVRQPANYARCSLDMRSSNGGVRQYRQWSLARNTSTNFSFSIPSGKIYNAQGACYQYPFNMGYRGGVTNWVSCSSGCTVNVNLR